MALTMEDAALWAASARARTPHMVRGIRLSGEGAVALNASAWRSIIVAESGAEWGSEEDPIALTAELRAMGAIVQRLGNLVRVVRGPRI